VGPVIVRALPSPTLVPVGQSDAGVTRPEPGVGVGLGLGDGEGAGLLMVMLPPLPGDAMSSAPHADSAATAVPLSRIIPTRLKLVILSPIRSRFVGVDARLGAPQI